MKAFYKFDAGSNYISYGQTGVKKGQQNPDWSEQFTFDYVESAERTQVNMPKP